MNEFATVFAAELDRRIRSRFFVIGLIAGALGIAFFIEFPNYLAKSSVTKIVLVGDAQLTSRAQTLLKSDFDVIGTEPGTHVLSAAELRARNANGAVMITRKDDGLHLAVYAKDPGDILTVTLRRDLVELNLELATNSSANRVKSLIDIPVDLHVVGSKFGTAAQSEAARGIAYILLSLLYLLIVMNSQFVMTSVAEEKTSRIAELLVASVSSTALLAAKVCASIVLAIVQMLSWVAVALALGGQTGAMPAASAAALGGSGVSAFSLSGVTASDLIGFGIFFLLGYLQMSMLFAAIGALVNRTEDLGSLSFPVLLPALVGFIIAMSALALPDATYVHVTSFIPLLSPYVMFERMVVSSVPLGEIIVAVALNVLAIWGIAILAGKLYRVGMLLYGRSPSYRQVLKVLRSG